LAPQSSTPLWKLALETLALVLSPLVTFFVLRIRAMSPIDLPDPSIHTIYIVDPSQMFTRYAAAFAPAARMREGAQAGYLVIARLFDLGFGAVPGFFATRYVFALITVVPAYLLMRRLYGIPAGVLTVLVLLSCPVIITAWGTDYPDSAVVSYAAGAVACLAMPARGRSRPAWIALAVGLLTLATFSHGAGALLCASTAVVYLVVRLLRGRAHLAKDAFMAVAVAATTTVGLMFASRFVLGQFNFISPTLKAVSYLSGPLQIAQWHSSNWRWAPYVSYLLVPPTVVVAFALMFARRWRNIPTPQLFVGLACAGQLGTFAYLQFFYRVQALEMHYFSSTLWGTVCLALSIVLAEMARPLWSRTLLRWLPAALVVGVALGYEAVNPQVPAFGWWPTGAIFAAVPVAICVIVRIWNRDTSVKALRRAALGLGIMLGVVGVTGCLLVLTVAPRPPIPKMKGLAKAGDPDPAYDLALGGSARSFIYWYRISTDLPAFVGDPAYQGEQLLMWFPWGVRQLLEPVGMFHEGYDALGPGFPYLSASDRHDIARRRPAEILLMGIKDIGFESALGALGRYEPVLLASTALRQGNAVLYVRLVLLRSFARPSVWPAMTR
jgi:hypothetical protein